MLNNPVYLKIFNEPLTRPVTWRAQLLLLASQDLDPVLYQPEAQTNSGYNREDLHAA